jgi:hypothetical protein
MAETITYTGGCHCGAVRCRVAAIPVHRHDGKSAPLE